MNKKLIINADDFGMTLPISRGILKVLSAGNVKSTSVMTNSPDFAASISEISNFKPCPDIGLHATLTWGRPLSDPKKIPTLVDEAGVFFSRNTLFLKALLGRISEDEVYLELCVQCERLKGVWKEISHLDGHHHAHIFPTICNAVTRVAKDFGVKYIRSPNEGTWSPWYKASVKRGLVSLLQTSHPDYWRAKDLLTTDNFGGYLLSAGPDLIIRWEKTFTNIPDLGITEIMVHPGYPSDNHDIYNEGREEELQLLINPLFSKMAASAGVELISFQDVM